MQLLHLSPAWEPNASEILFYSLLLRVTHVGVVKDLQSWQTNVVREADAATES